METIYRMNLSGKRHRQKPCGVLHQPLSLGEDATAVLPVEYVDQSFGHQFHRAILCMRKQCLQSGMQYSTSKTFTRWCSQIRDRIPGKLINNSYKPPLENAYFVKLEDCVFSGSQSTNESDCNRVKFTIQSIPNRSTSVMLDKLEKLKVETIDQIFGSMHDQYVITNDHMFIVLLKQANAKPTLPRVHHPRRRFGRLFRLV